MKYFLRLILLWIGCTWNGIPLSGQSTATPNVSVRFLSTDDGMAGRFVNYTYQDRRGILWVGTQFGLHRYDGREFVVFNEDDGLPFPQIMEIHEGLDGWLWLYCSCQNKPDCTKKLVLFNSITYEVRTLEEHLPFSVLPATSTINDIIADEEGRIYFTIPGQLFYRDADLNWQKVNLSLGHKPIYLLKTLEGNKLAAYYFHFKNKTDLHYLWLQLDGQAVEKSHFTSSYNLLATEFRSLGMDDQQRLHYKMRFKNQNVVDLFYLDQDGLLYAEPHHNEENSTLYHIPWNSSYLTKSKTNAIYEIFNAKGELVCDLSNWHPLFKRDQFVRHISHTDDGSIWISGRNGLIQVKLEKSAFEQILCRRSPEWDGTGKPLALSVCKIDDQRVLLSISGTNNRGLYLWEKGEVSLVLNNEVEYKNTRALTLGYDQKVWAIQDYALLGLDTSDWSQQEYEFPRELILASPNTLFYHDRKLWIGTHKGLWVFDHQTERFQSWLPPGMPPSCKESLIRSFHYDGDNLLWMTTSTGLYRYQLNNDNWKHYHHLQEGDQYLPAVDFYDMRTASSGGYWLSSKKGLIHWTPQAKPAYRHYTIEDGLATNWVLAAYEDEWQNLWLPTNQGLIQFNPQNLDSRVWLIEDGLSHREFEPQAHFQDEDGTLFLGTTNGFTRFNPRDIQQGNNAANNDIALVVLDFEQVSGEANHLENLTSELLAEQKIIMRPEHRFSRIRLGLSNFNNAENNRFAYRIEGYQEQWQEGNNNTIQLGRLPYGSYNLHIKGRLPNGQYSTQELQLPILVLRPFYWQTWFWLLLSTLTLLSLGAIYRWRLRLYRLRQIELERVVDQRTVQIRKDNDTIERQASELRQLDGLKSRFFANVSHELRTPLSLILGPIDSMLKSRKLDPRNFALGKLVQNNTRELLRLVNEILDLSKLESGKLEVVEQPTLLFPFLQRLVGAFESLGQDKNIQLEFRYCADEYLQVQIDRRKFEKVVNNFLSNAFKYSESGALIKVALYDRANHLRLEVSDTGRGIHQDDLPQVFERFYQSRQIGMPVEGGSGIGLAICREFAQLMDGKVGVNSEWGKGSTFFFELPKKEVMGVSSTETSELNWEEEEERAEPNLSELLGGVEEMPTRQRILVVEDNPSLRSYIELLLTDDYEIITAGNGEEALKVLETQGNISLILSDIMMPVMDGYQLLEKVKADDRWRHLPFLMLTARADLADRLKALRIGVDDYLLKPFEEVELQARLANLLRNSWARIGQGQVMETTVMADGVEEAAEEPLLSAYDLEWLEELEALVLKGLTQFHFNVEQMAVGMNVSRQTLNRKIKKVCGLTAIHYLQEARLNRALRMLEEREVDSVKVAALEVGFKDIRYFSRQFTKKFGKKPSDYLS